MTRKKERLELGNHLHKAAELASSLESTYQALEPFLNLDLDDEPEEWVAAQEMIDKLQPLIQLSDDAGELEEIEQKVYDAEEPPLAGDRDIAVANTCIKAARSVMTLAQYRDRFRDELYRRCGILEADIDERYIENAHKEGEAIYEAIQTLADRYDLHDADRSTGWERTEWTGTRPDKTPKPS